MPYRVAKMLEPLTEQMLAEISCLEPVYVDGIMGFINLGATFLIAFFRWKATRGENGLWRYERVPALVTVQPKSAILSPTGVTATALAMQPAPAEAALMARH
jgi:hypothetical protein